jgi:hypothetical protein
MECGSEASALLKRTLQHSKGLGARLPSPTQWERGGGEGKKSGRTLHTMNSSDVPLSDLQEGVINCCFCELWLGNW